MSYKHVLFATDLTDEALPAGRKAVDLAKALGARFSLLHVLRNRDLGSGGEAGSMSADSRQWVERQQQALQSLARQLGVEQHEHWVEVAQAVPHAIDHAAVEHGVDLIVMGNHARGGLGRFLNTTTDDLLHYTRCDMLAVRVPEEQG